MAPPAQLPSPSKHTRASYFRQPDLRLPSLSPTWATKGRLDGLVEVTGFTRSTIEVPNRYNIIAAIQGRTTGLAASLVRLDQIIFNGPDFYHVRFY